MKKILLLFILLIGIINAVDYIISTPFDEDEIPLLQYAINDNTMYLVNGTDIPQLLTRTAHNAWTMADMTMETGPFLDDIDDWKKKDDWSLPFELEDSKLKEKELPYTRVIMEKLHEETKKQFRDDLYIKDLRDSISKMYTYFIDEYIDIYINRNKIQHFPLSIRYSDSYKPSVYRERINDVDIEIICFKIV